MSRAGAPSQILKRKNAEGGTDVTIMAPAAIWNAGGSKLPPVPAGEQVSKDDIIAMQATLIKELEGKLASQEIAASTISVTTCALIKAICDGTGVGVSDVDDYTIEIPKHLYRRLEGAQLEIAGIKQDHVSPVYARIVPKSDAETDWRN